MSQKTLVYAFAFLVLSCAAALAKVPKDMIGNWRWHAFTTEVSECQPGQLCAKVIAGPKSVGMEIFASKLVVRGDEWQGQIVDPETKQLYHTRFREIDARTWRLSGCTATGVCLSGEFVRIK
jgi:uncharacterized protein (DUF2147 family)